VRGAARLGIIPYGAGAGTIDLGNEPPMILGKDNEEEKLPIPHAVSWRWLSGTVLTGVTSIFLMGAALMAALSNPKQFASLPESFMASIVNDDGLIFGRKADRIRPLEHAEEQQHVSTRQVIQVSTVIRQSDRDFVKLRPFARIDASLGLASPQIASQVPAYDPARLFADDSEPAPTAPVPIATIAAPGAAAAAAASQAAPKIDDVSFKVTDFPVASPDLDPGTALDTDEVEQIVRAAAHIGGDATVASLDPPEPDTAANKGKAVPAGVKIVPENVSTIAKSGASDSLDDGYQEKIVSVVKPESLKSLFDENAISGDDANEIIAALSQLVDVSRLRPGQKVRIAFATDPAAAALDQPNADNDGPDNADQPVKSAQRPLSPIRVSIYDNGAHQATVARADNNAFVRADEPSVVPELFAETPPPPPDTTDDGAPPTLYQAVYQTALAQQMPKPLIEQLIKMFAYDVDFQSHITVGDSLEVLHSLPDPSDTSGSDPEILYAALNLDGTEKRLYRFRTPDDSVVDYYDENGVSAKKFLVRKPIAEGIITSPFGWRVHPLLGYRRLHAGVDYAAPKGTPIFAAGNGIIEKAGVSSGYGNMIEIRHANGYETVYGHQSAFAKGITPGVPVHQGQIIGYVGSTGLSTGPHVHFEVRINGQPVDPLRIRLPRGRELEDNYLTEFETERARVDDLLGGGATPQVTAAADASTQ